MNLYEMVYIARAELSQAQINTLNTDLTEFITSNNGKVSKLEHWGIKNFAYRLKKRNKGHYCLLNIELDAESLKKLEHKIALNESILRILNVKVDSHDNAPSIMMTKPAYNKYDNKDGGKYDRNSTAPSETAASTEEKDALADANTEI